MATGNEEVRVAIALPVETNAEQAASSVEQLRDKIEASKNASRDAFNALKSLRGETDEIKKAKDELRAAMKRENEAVSAATLELLKQGTSYDKVSAAAKQAAAAQAAAAAAQQKDAQLAADAQAKATAEQAKAIKAEQEKARATAEATAAAKQKADATHAEKRATEAAKFSTASYTENAKMLGTALVAVAAAAVAVTAALVGGIVKLARWAITSADAARSMGLIREAATGSAENARALGTQIDALADKVPTSKEALNELAVQLAKNGVQGQTLVDTFNAVGQASAAMGAQAASTLQGLVERGRLSKVFTVSPQELQGTGVAFDDLAKEIAATMKVGIGDARAALFEGRVKLADGAKAMRSAVEKKFGEINLRKMMSLEGLTETLHKRLSGLTSGINLERGLAPMSKLLNLLDESTFSGTVLKKAITAFGNGVVTAFEQAAPKIEAFTKGLIIGGLEVYIAYLKVKKAIGGAFGDVSVFKNLDLVKTGVTVAKAAIVGLTVALGAMAAITAVAFAPFVYVGKLLADLSAGFVDLVAKIAAIDWGGSARAMIDGLVRGLTDGASRVASAVGQIAEDVKTRFKNALGIHSPSKVFAEYGSHTTEGFRQGVEDGSGDAQAAVAAMVSTPSGASGSSSSGATATINATLVVQVQGGGSAGDALEDPALLAKFQKLLEDAAAAAGIRVTA